MLFYYIYLFKSHFHPHILHVVYSFLQEYPVRLFIKKNVFISYV